MSRHRKQGGKMKSASHPNGMFVTPYESAFCDIKIVSYNEDGSYQAKYVVDPPLVSPVFRFIRRTVFVREDLPPSKRIKDDD